MLPLRLRSVLGIEGRLNDTLFQPAARPAASPEQQNTLVFFPGDVQDYPEVMAANRDSRVFHQWNLERTASLLAQNFPHHHVLVVRPSRIELHSFSCYDNFVASDKAGVPRHAPAHRAFAHLARLLASVSARLAQAPAAELPAVVSSASLPEYQHIEDSHTGPSSRRGGAHSSAGAGGALHSVLDPPRRREQLSLDRSRLTLVGFSKGCVVLNQLVYELEERARDASGAGGGPELRLACMYWLDGGHAGRRDTWVTSRGALRALARLGVRVYVHVSPYQVQDEARPWIGREERIFTSVLAGFGAQVSRYLHEGGAPHSLHTHFDVLANFKRVQDGAPAGDTDAPADT